MPRAARLEPRCGIINLHTDSILLRLHMAGSKVQGGATVLQLTTRAWNKQGMSTGTADDRT